MLVSCQVCDYLSPSPDINHWSPGIRGACSLLSSQQILIDRGSKHAYRPSAPYWLRYWETRHPSTIIKEIVIERHHHILPHAGVHKISGQLLNTRRILVLVNVVATGVGASLETNGITRANAVVKISSSGIIYRLLERVPVVDVKIREDVEVNIGRHIYRRTSISRN